MKKLVFIQDISLTDSPKVRIEVRDEVVKEYAEQMKAGEAFPPVLLFLSRKTKQYLIADGWHRVEAAKVNKQRGITAEVRDGEYEDALIAALVANTRHGLRRSVADKEASVRAAVKQWPGKSNVAIAKACAIDDHIVGSVRKELEQVAAIPVTKVREATERVSQVGNPGDKSHLGISRAC